MSNQLKDHVFVVEAGQEVVNGKSTYPDLVRLVLPKDKALSFAMEVLRSLQTVSPNESMLMEIPLFGRLEKLDDE